MLSSNLLLHTSGGDNEFKIQPFDPDGRRRILIYRKRHTVPLITVAHLRVILTLGLMRKMCWIVLVLNLSPPVLCPVLTSGSVSEVHSGTNCYLLPPTRSALLLFILILVARQRLNLNTVHVSFLLDLASLLLENQNLHIPK